MPLDRVQDFASTPALTIAMAAATRPAFCRLRVGNSQVSSASPMRRLVGSHDEPVSLMPSLAVQTSGGCVYVDGVPLARLLVCTPQRRFDNEKGHGVLDVVSSSAASPTCSRLSAEAP